MQGSLVRLAVAGWLLWATFAVAQNAPPSAESPPPAAPGRALPDRQIAPPGAPEPPFPGGPFPGPGFPGGGPGFFGRGPGGPSLDRSRLTLSGQAAFQQELTLDDAQKAAIGELQADLRRRTQAVFSAVDFGALPDLEPEQREALLAGMRNKVEAIQKTADESLVARLTEPQRTRLEQLYRQHQGAAVLASDEAARYLELSPEQREKIRRIPQLDAPPFAPAEIRRQTLADALALLDAPQQARWKTWIGAEFKFPEPTGRAGFGPPGGVRPDRALVASFDRDKNGWLDADERSAARALLKQEREQRPAAGPGGFGPPGFGPPPGVPGGLRGPGGFGPGGRAREPAAPGPPLAPADVQPAAGDLYDETVLRTLFLNFESAEWETELAEFHGTDVDVPAELVVDGRSYPRVGVRFRGMSSYGMVGRGHKRSLNLALDLADSKQRLHGRKTLNLLNSHEDPSFLHAVLYLRAARDYLPAPKANFVRVVINGESWGLYVNAEQFNKEFMAEHFSGGGARWKVPGSPAGRGGLEYLGDDVAAYKRLYELKSKDDPAAWQALIKLCKTLHETPLDRLAEALAPQLDVDGALRFLALETTLVNNDGYWTRASDYNLALDRDGRFHLVPHDANETFQEGMFPGGPGGPGGGRRPGGIGLGPAVPGAPPAPGPATPRPAGPGFGPGRSGGVTLDPLVGLDDPSKPLRSRLLAVPALRTKYLQYVRQIADQWLDWSRLEPLVRDYERLIDAQVAADTKKLSSYAEFKAALAAEPAAAEPPAAGAPPRRSASLRDFVERRRKFLQEHPAIRALETGDRP